MNVFIEMYRILTDQNDTTPAKFYCFLFFHNYTLFQTQFNLKEGGTLNINIFLIKFNSYLKKNKI